MELNLTPNPSPKERGAIGIYIMNRGYNESWRKRK
jgi:hypothetical protein